MNKILRPFIFFLVLTPLSLSLLVLGNSINSGIYDSYTGDINNRVIDDVLIIAIDDDSFKELDRRWPWPRTWIADVINKLTDSNVGAIGIDISLFDRGFTDDEDEALAEALKRSGKVTLINRWIKEADGSQHLYEPLDIFRQNTETGYGNLFSDHDGVVRRYDYLMATDGDIDLMIQSFAYSIYMTWLDGEYPPEEDDDPFLDYYTFDGTPKESSDWGLKGNRLIDYRNMGTYDIPKISFSEILAGNYDKNQLSGKAVLIGATYPESHDQYAASGTSDELVYGVDIHGHALAGLMKGSFPHFPSFKISILTLFISIICITVIISFMNFLPGLISLILLTSVSYLIQYLTWMKLDILLSLGYFFLPIIPALIIFSVWHFFIESKQRKKIRGEFSRFVAPAVVNQIVSSKEAPKLGGERRDVTVLFSDIVGFTPMSEEMEPEEIVSLLNRYFTIMVDIIYKYEGTINKFIGDAIMAVFGAPISQEDHEKRAVLAAIEMTEALNEFNKNQKNRGERQIGTGIGINSGPVVVGNVGSERQMEYTVIGDTVNLSARLESLTRTYGQIVISDNVYQKVKDYIEVTKPEPVMVKGKSNLIDIYVVKNRVKEEEL